MRWRVRRDYGDKISSSISLITLPAGVYGAALGLIVAKTTLWILRVARRTGAVRSSWFYSRICAGHMVRKQQMRSAEVDLIVGGLGPGDAQRARAGKIDGLTTKLMNS